jgi:hypothetical protein
MSSAPARSETALYPAVKAFLEAQDYHVKGEIRGCDIVAVRAGEPPILVIAEFKLGFNLELVLQGVDRMRSADAVWLAVPATRRGRDRDGRAHRLCRLLGLGLLAVGSRGGVEILAEPLPYRPRPNTRERKRLLREHGARRGDPTPGGSTRQKIMTAYRQIALDCAAALQPGPLPLKTLRAQVPQAGTIVQRNFYGWFEREARGIYRLNQAGEAALARWPTLLC